MKKYMKPEISIELIQVSSMILAGSGVESGDSVGNEYNSSDVTYSRGRGFWDDED
ncbi:MAG: hypothetical protein IJV45_05705 [Prevotella sp.]|nr:hypothetical protein [Prevotella sp.]